jgi:hypothetical protein
LLYIKETRFGKPKSYPNYTDVCNVHRKAKTTNKHQKHIQYQRYVKPLGAKDFTGKSLTLHSHLQITQLLQLRPLILEMFLPNPNKMQGQMNRNIFKEHETTSHSASKDIARNTNSNHNSLGRPGASREIKMAKATSSKRHSNSDTSNPRKRSLTHQGSSSQPGQYPIEAIWLGFPTIEEITKQVSNKPIDLSCSRTND